MINLNKQRGMSILGVIVFGVVVILVLSYFRINIKSIVESPSGQENINYVGGGLKTFWENHLKEPFSKFLNGIISKTNETKKENSNPTTSKPNPTN